MLEEVTRKVGTPRALSVPYALGYPLGKPGDPALQTRILRAAFALLDAPGPILAGFSEAWSPIAP
jgi:hypothetical protein